MAKKQKYYAVKVGKVPGIYETWSECQEQIKGFPNAIYKSFKSKTQAENFVKVEEKMEVNSGYEFYVDGSYNADNDKAGSGVIIVKNGEVIGQCHAEHKNTEDMRNVVGEVMASLSAMKIAKNSGINNFTILHDYMGVSAWAKGEWETKTSFTKTYKKWVDKFIEEGLIFELDNRKFMNTMKTTIARYDLDEGFKDRFIKYLEDSIFESSKRVTIASRESFERKRRESIMGTL